MNLSMDQKIKVLEIAVHSLKDTKFSVQFEDMQIRYNSLMDILYCSVESENQNNGKYILKEEGEK